MKVIMKKRRYYKGKFREPGQTIDMDDKYVRAYLRVSAVEPAITKAPAKSNAQPTQITRTRTSAPPQTIEETALEEMSVDAQEQADVQEEPTAVGDTTVEDSQIEFAPGDDGAEAPVELSDPFSAFDNMSFKDLQEACKKKGLSAKGSTVELIERLKEGE